MIFISKILFSFYDIKKKKDYWLWKKFKNQHKMFSEDLY